LLHFIISGGNPYSGLRYIGPIDVKLTLVQETHSCRANVGGKESEGGFLKVIPTVEKMTSRGEMGGEEREGGRLKVDRAIGERNHNGSP
jgi:hypothetical protein